MDNADVWRVYVSMSPAQRYYYRNRKQKQEENLMRYYENRERINAGRRERYRVSVDAAGSHTGLS